ncbi:MAG: hypothetical protein EXS35_17095 [Pedosphaera sp.]|nr:hypothetical protein [Pedosphaera sp.]
MNDKPFFISWCIAGVTASLLNSSSIIVAAEATPAGKQDEPKNTKLVEKVEALPSPLGQRWELRDPTRHRDFPVLALDATGTAWVAFIEHNGKSDIVKLARKTGGTLAGVTDLSEPGVMHQPAIACGADGAVWCFWGQLDARNIVTLRARRFAGGKLEPQLTLAASPGSDTFADAGTDRAGRVWVVWQSLRRGQGDVFARWLDPQSKKWSPEIAVSKPQGGNWEPRLAFDGRDGAWVAFDSSRGGEFNLFLAHVDLNGAAKEQQLTSSPEYEARASIAATKDGKRLWISAERGRRQWGRQLRGHVGDTGLNGEKRILLGEYEIASGKFNEIAVPAEGKPAPRAALEVNLPVLGTDAAGNPWLAYRYYSQNRWLMAVMKYNAMEKSWAQPMEVPDSSFGQDRHCTLARDGARMMLCWASDRRESKLALVAGVYLAELAPKFTPYREPTLKISTSPEPKPYLNPVTPDRPRDEHHIWNVGGQKYTLVFGDLHRHTDFSNCRCGQDGCVLEHFRYAYDMAELDFMGTSDHSDVGKKYDPYEWWQTQRSVDIFYTPGKFNSLYAYEREQRYPWGHRNVVFSQRGGPVVYIKRNLYKASPWNALYPVTSGGEEITPMELWAVLHKYGQPVALISHTGATGMGTDWDKYEQIDRAFENTVEIFQGARVSYEGLGTPQPTAGLRVGQKYTPDTASKAVIPEPPAAIADFGPERNNGVYQHALARGHKLGVFASSDHISQHTSFGGVYVKAVTREGIIEGFRARRSIGATDKIFVEFSCDGKSMGSVLETFGKPKLKFFINGTAPLKRVTLVRNETDHQTWEPGRKEIADGFTDAAPLPGENRYYLRVEQTDGNMAWSSPVWVTVKAPAQR